LEYVLMEGENMKEQSSNADYQYLEDFKLGEFPNIHPVKQLTKEGYLEILNNNSKRYQEEPLGEIFSIISPIKEMFINALCHPNVIEEIKKRFEERYKIEIQLKI